MVREGRGPSLMTLPTGVINLYPVPAPSVSLGACRSGGRQQHAQGDEVLPQGTVGPEAAVGLSRSREIRQRKAGPRDPYATGLSKPCLSGSRETPSVDLHPCRARVDYPT